MAPTSLLLFVVASLLAPAQGFFAPQGATLHNPFPNSAVAAPRGLRMTGSAVVERSQGGGFGFGGAGPAVLDRPELKDAKKIEEAPKYRVHIFNDSLHTREFVARCLRVVVGMPEGEAFDIMQKAHKDGFALVGIWREELAEAYTTDLKGRGLVAEMTPAD
ncbi:unnamed protein product [Phaeothamnion confervicola]